MQPQINTKVLMSGADFFDDTYAINAFMDSSRAVNRGKAIEEHFLLRVYLEQVGIEVLQTPAPAACQDGVYTANWAVVRGNKAVMASLPSIRQPEEATAEATLRDLGLTIYHVPGGLRFSGQGDALACGSLLFMNFGYRTDRAVHDFVAETLGYDVISLQTIPATDETGAPIINVVSGWPDSYFYDIDLALSILRAPHCSRLDLAQPCARSNLEHKNCTRGLIAWCPEAFMPESQSILRKLDSVDKIEVSLHEAMTAFACNLISTGSTVIMSKHAPLLRQAVEAQGLQVIAIDLPELSKGGGFIRCTTLTLD
ncbi:hypothetical protein JNM87_02590 [Candidatus Saccharibacteria bacterium]|nr:hypothetical protein [Candidatus Saccharibacteria bacterium]